MNSTECPHCGRRMNPKALTKKERIAFIHEILKDGRPVIADEFAFEMDVSKRTVIRDIIFMRERLGAPIVGSSRGYHYQDCSWELAGAP